MYHANPDLLGQEQTAAVFMVENFEIFVNVPYWREYNPPSSKAPPPSFEQILELVMHMSNAQNLDV